MNPSIILFYILVAITLLSAIGVAVVKNILYAALFLLITFIGIAGLYIFISADYIATTQIMVYVGGVLVLLIFGIMLTNKIGIQNLPNPANNQISSLIISLILGSILVTGILNTDYMNLKWIQENAQVGGKTTSYIGFKLLTDYIFAFEIASILILVALIGATFTASKTIKKTYD